MIYVTAAAEEIHACGHVITHSRYFRVKNIEDDGSPLGEKKRNLRP